MAAEPGTGPLVAAAGLTVRHRGKAVLESVDLRVDRGEIVTLIGPNGSGKTTLIRTLLGLTKPDAGEVRRSPRLRIGYMPQHLEIDKTLPLTVGRFLTLKPGVDRDRAAQALAEVGTPQILGRSFHELSGGEIKRAMLARAVLGQPDLLVLDEPTANVDVVGQAEFYELIRAIRDRHGPGVLVVSHDLHLVMAATDRVVCLNGHVCCQGAPEKVSRDPAYLALFGPRLGDTLAIYAHDHDHHHDLSGEAVAHDHDTPDGDDPR